MKRHFLGLIVLLAGWIAFAPGQVRFESTGFQRATEKAMRARKLMFVYFYTDWCAPCKQIPTIVFGDSLIRAAIDSQYISLKLNAEKGEGLTLAKKYNVGGFPTFLYLNSQGQVSRAT